VISRRWIPAAGVVVLVWLGLAYCTGPPDAHEYRRTAVAAAQAGLGAVRTVALAGDAQEHGRLWDPYLATVLDDQIGSVASAQEQVSASVPPDDATRRVRDQLLPLLADAGREIGDLSAALDRQDRAAVRTHLDRLRALGDRLDDFVERYG
jgi:hypothetical protein